PIVWVSVYGPHMRPPTLPRRQAADRDRALRRGGGAAQVEAHPGGARRAARLRARGEHAVRERDPALAGRDDLQAAAPVDRVVPDEGRPGEEERPAWPERVAAAVADQHPQRMARVVV